jgi:hypothetical protein
MKLKDFFKGLFEGFYYIGKGFSTISLYPNLDYRMLTDKEAFNEDICALAGDWRAIGRDLEKVMKEENKK